MRILAVDDEPLALEGLVLAIKEAKPDAEVISFQKSIEALEYMRRKSCQVAFLDIEMYDMNGIELAKRMKAANLRINIIFVTGYMQYMENAFALRASGYLVKPVSSEQVRTELDELRNPIREDETRLLTVRTFQNFEVFSGGKPVEFGRSKAKEIFAYLIDRNGSRASFAEIAAILWEDSVYDRAHQKQLYNCIDCLIKALSAVGAENVILKDRLGLMVDVSKLDCDAYRFLEGDPSAINAYRGEYMSTYSWAEFSIGRFR